MVSASPLSLGRRLGLLAFGLAIGLGVLELDLRIFWARKSTIAAGLEHPQFHHRLKPSHTYHYYSPEFDVRIRTNRFGLRGPEPAIPKPPGALRILMLGDSFTFGFPVKDEETFAHLIEQGLRRRGYPVEVVNGGVSGYSPTLEYLSLRDDFMKFEPDLVMVWYDYGDLQEDYWYQKNLRTDASGRITGCDPRYRDGRFDRWEWMKNHSALIKWVDVKLFRTIGKVRVLGFTGYLAVKLRGERAKVAIAKLKAARQTDDAPAHDRFFLLREATTPEMISRYWALTGRYLTLMRDELAPRGVPLLLASYPYGMTVGPDQWAKGRTFWGFEAGKVYPDAGVAATLSAFAARERIPFIDAADSFRAAASAQPLFYEWDGHMIAAGHRVLAEHVLRDPALARALGKLRQQLGLKDLNG